MKNIRVLIADDHMLIIDSLKSILIKQTSVFKIDYANTKKDVFAFLNTMKVDVLFLDVNMNGINMLEYVQQLKQLNENLKIIILTSYNSQVIISEALQNKVDAYLLKNSSENEIITAYNSVLNGNTYLNIGQVKQFNTTDNFELKMSLTKRELDIIKCLALGETNSIISNHLNISIHTIQTHRKNIHKKLDINSVTELISFAFQNGLT